MDHDFLINCDTTLSELHLTLDVNPGGLGCLDPSRFFVGRGVSMKYYIQ